MAPAITGPSASRADAVEFVIKASHIAGLDSKASQQQRPDTTGSCAHQPSHQDWWRSRSRHVHCHVRGDARPHRGHGYGRLLLERTAAYARALGFGRVVLWTSDQACFYQRCGYVPCRPLNLVAPVVASMLNARSLSSLQRTLAQRQHSNDSVIQNADDNDAQDNPLTSIWLHKRLIPSFPPFRMPRDACETDVITQLQRQRVNSFHCLLLDVPNETQIGPCCGIAALRCVYQYFVSNTNDQTSHLLGHSTAADNKDLVQVARDAGYSIDGEMFQATNLAALATAHLHLPVQVVTNLSAVELCQHIYGGRPILVPFDKNMTDLEHAVGLNGGRHAHWGVVRGVAVPTTTADDITATHIVWHPDTIVVNNVDKNVFVIVQHTNHDRLVVVPWQRLHDSNAQVDDCGDKDDGRQALGLQIQPRQLAGQWLVVSAPSDSSNGKEGP